MFEKHDIKTVNLGEIRVYSKHKKRGTTGHRVRDPSSQNQIARVCFFSKKNRGTATLKGRYNPNASGTNK